ncbi:hypothetical protein H9P43_003616 [Blastocladiella emersonii ATCC 22665]|nr:hypothetical protein H9P43_003616 [Blastocladiella emersonii ATCC 22665]
MFDVPFSVALARLRPPSFLATDLIMLCFDVGSCTSLERIATKWCPEVRNNHLPARYLYVVLGPCTDCRGTSRDALSSEYRDVAHRLGDHVAY